MENNASAAAWPRHCRFWSFTEEIERWKYSCNTRGDNSFWFDNNLVDQASERRALRAVQCWAVVKLLKTICDLATMTSPDPMHLEVMITNLPPASRSVLFLELFSPKHDLLAWSAYHLSPALYVEASTFFSLSPSGIAASSFQPCREQGSPWWEPQGSIPARLISSSYDQPCSATATSAKFILSLLPFACVQASAAEVLCRTMYGSGSRAVRCARSTDKVPVVPALFILPSK